MDLLLVEIHPGLVHFWTLEKNADRNFEVVYVPCDEDEASYELAMSETPWFANVTVFFHIFPARTLCKILSLMCAYVRKMLFPLVALPLHVKCPTRACAGWVG